MPDEQTSTQISHSQINAPVTTGDHNQITVYHVEEGAVVHVHGPEKRPTIQPLPTPRDLRAQPFAGLQGREAEVAAATAALKAGRVVEVFGPSGIGKSSLLRFLQYEPATDRFPDGVIHLFQGALPILDQLQALYDAFFTADVPYKPTESAARQALHAMRALVIIDDAERSREELEQLRGWLPAATFIFASAERRLFGEGEAIPLLGLKNQAALALLEREFGRPLTAAEWKPATALCEALHGHPLQLKEAAAEARAGASLTDLVSQSGQKPSWTKLLALTDAALMTLLEQAEAGKRLLDALRAGGPTDEGWTTAVERVLAAQQALLQAPKPEQDDDRALLLYLSIELGKDAGLWSSVISLVRSASGPLLASRRWATWQSLIEAALLAANRLGDQAAEAWSLHQLGAHALCLGQVQRAHAFLTQAEVLRVRLGDEAGLKVTRQNLQSVKALTVTAAPVVGRPQSRWPRIAQTVSILTVAAVTGLVVGTQWQDEPAQRPAPALAAILTVELAQIDFGPTDLRVPVAQSVVLRNRGETTAQIEGVQVLGGTAFHLINQNGCSQLEAEQSCTLQLQFAPPSGGRHTDSLAITYNGAQRLDLTLTGMGRDVPTSKPPVIDTGALPDLVVTEFVPVGRTGARVTIQNQGKSPAPVFKVAILLAQAGVAASNSQREFLIPFGTKGQEAQPTPFTQGPLGPGETIVLQGLIPTGVSTDLLVEVDSCYAEPPTPFCRVQELDETNNRRPIDRG
ncbi:MAG TPA: choice-of-anchor D domain-containing protein [Symbiobacteriaceae bacterium]|nr:choice-of-anchor D domain-containing protein [Symbiobacteriaceae bacterium]